MQSDLMNAIWNGDVELLRSCVGNVSSGDAPEALHLAAYLGNEQMLRLLVEHGFSQFLNGFDDFSFTPLMWAAKGEHFACVEYLVSAGAQVNAYDAAKIGNTALREVAREGSLQIISLLLANGADPSIPGWMQLTALDVARQRFEDNPSPDNRKILDLCSNG